MPVATVNWLWIGNRSLLDATPNNSTPILLSERRALLGYDAAGRTEIKPTSVSGDYVSQGVNANSFATVWDANAKGIAPTRFSYNLDGTPVENITMISAFGVTMRVQTASEPDVFQDQPATLVQMGNGDMFFRPNANVVGAWDAIDRVYSIEVAAIDESAGSAYGSINQRTTLKPDIFDVAFPCFAAGSLILTEGGERRVETLRPGDLVATADHGLRPVKWVGSRTLDRKALDRHPALRPVRITANALGPGIPARDLVVSQQHRILVRSRVAARLFGADEILIAAKHLVGLEGIAILTDLESVTYVHVMFDAHEVILAEGAETESLYAGSQALRALPEASLRELHLLFPELAQGGIHRPARPFATGPLRRDLIRRHTARDRPLVLVPAQHPRRPFVQG